MPIFNRPRWSDARDSTAPRPQGRNGREAGLPESAPPAGAPWLRGPAMSLRPARLQALDLELPATPTSVTTARHAVAEFCNGHALDHGAVALAVTEAAATPSCTLTATATRDLGLTVIANFTDTMQIEHDGRRYATDHALRARRLMTRR